MAISGDYLTDIENVKLPYPLIMFEVFIENIDKLIEGFIETYQDDPMVKLSTGGDKLKQSASLMIMAADENRQLYIEPFVILSTITNKLTLIPAGIMCYIEPDSGKLWTKLSPYLIQFQEAGAGIQQDSVEEVSMAYIHVMAYVLAMLENDKMIEEDVTYRESVQNKRTKRGKPPFIEHKILTLGLPRRVYESSESGEHAGRKMHYRRGHWRHFNKRTRAGKTKTWIKPMMVGDPSLGIIVKDYYLKGEENE